MKTPPLKTHASLFLCPASGVGLGFAGEAECEGLVLLELAVDSSPPRRHFSGGL